MRIGRGGGASHTTSLRNSCSAMYLNTAISNRSEEIFKRHSNGEDNVRSVTLVINEMSMGNKYIGRETPAGGHHVQSSDNNNFSV